MGVGGWEPIAFQTYCSQSGYTRRKSHSLRVYFSLALTCAHISLFEEVKTGWGTEPLVIKDTHPEPSTTLLLLYLFYGDFLLMAKKTSVLYEVML